MDAIIEVLRKHWEVLDFDDYPMGCACGWNQVEEDIKEHIAGELLKVVTLR